MSTHPELSEQVYVDDGRDGVIVRTQERVGVYDGRVVDQYVHGTQVHLDFDRQRGDLRAGCHVHRVRLGYGPLDLGRDQLHRLVVAALVHVHARHLGAQQGELQRQLTAQPSSGTGDLRGAEKKMRKKKQS